MDDLLRPARGCIYGVALGLIGLALVGVVWLLLVR